MSAIGEASIERVVSIPVGDIHLDAELHTRFDSCGLVIFIHDSGSTRHSPRNQFVAEIVRNAGMGTLLLDLLTPQEQAEDEREHNLRFNIPILGQRLLAVSIWVSRQPIIGDLPLGYFGASTGAAAALIAAASLRNVVRAVVSRGGRADLAMEELSFVKAPTLLIVGERDQFVLQLNRHIYAQLNCEKELVIVPKATHRFEEPGTLEHAANLATGWFRRHLRHPEEDESSMPCCGPEIDEPLLTTN